MNKAIIQPIIVVKNNDLKPGQFTMTNPDDWDAMQNGANMPEHVSNLLTEDNKTPYVVNVLLSDDPTTTNALVDIVTNLQAEYSSLIKPDVVKDIVLKTMDRTMETLEGNDYIPQFTTHVLMNLVYGDLDT